MLDHLGEGFVARNLYEALAFAESLLTQHFCRKNDCACAGEYAPTCLCLAKDCPSAPREGNA
jgi:hypothetical protein